MASSVLQFLRAADWLDAQRVRGYALLLGIASCALLAVSSERAMGPQGSDFLAFWGAGKVAFAGDPELACDLATQRRVQTATGSANWLAFVNPPPFLLLAALLGALPYPLAWLAWTGLTLAAWALAAIGAFPRLWPLVAVFPGALLAAGHAQTGLLTGALLIGGVSLLDRRRLLAGILFGALVIKPHLALLVPIWLAAGRRWRALAALAAGAIGLGALSIGAFGLEMLRAYPQAWQASAALLRSAGPDFYLRMARFPRPVRARHAGRAGAPGACRASPRRCCASPYLFNYDLPFLALPLLWLVGQGLAHGFRPFEKLALVALFVAPYASRAAALPLGVNLMPLASSALLALVWARGLPALTKVLPSRHIGEQIGNRCGTAGQAVH